jgi:hypothetical protein
METYLNMINQMRECGGGDVPVPAPAAAAAKGPRFASLPSKYGLKQHPIYPQAAASDTYEEEFNRFRNQIVSPPDTDLVQYWGVSAAINNFSN